MRKVRGWKIFITLAAIAILAVGCGSKGKEEPPAELPKITPEVTLQQLWSHSIGDGQGDEYNLLTPAVEGDNIYAAASDGEVYSLDRATGRVIWHVDLNEPISGGVGVGYGLVLVGTLRGEVIALAEESGKELWRHRISSEVLSTPVNNGDVVVVQAQDDQIFALDALSGEQRWMFANDPAALSLRGTSSPLVTSQLVVAPLSTGRVIALDTQRGLPIWEATVAVPNGRTELERMVDIDGGLLRDGDSLYVVSYQGHLAALDLSSGHQLWQIDANSYNGVAEGYHSLYISDADGTVTGIDAATNTQLWQNKQLARRQLSSPAVLSNYVAVGDYQGYLHLLSQADGRLVGQLRVDSGGLRARPLVVDDTLYAYGNGGELAAYKIR